jgi:diacylglycerol O-acyltransferase
MTAVYPLVPLFGRQALGIALFSYAGNLHWGLVGDWQSTPDLHDLVGDLEASLEELETVARAAAKPESKW